MLLESCNLIPSLSCELSITTDYIESTCGLTNGVLFEELMVDSSGKDGVPVRYKAIRVYGANPFAHSGREENRIYFNGDDGNCYWWTEEPTDGDYINEGTSRHKVSDVSDLENERIADTIIQITPDSIVVKQGNRTAFPDQDVARDSLQCPLQLKRNTWYFVNFRDQRYEAYLHVGADMGLQLFKIDKPTNF